MSRALSAPGELNQHGPQATGARMNAQRAAGERGGGAEILRANFKHDGLEEDLCVRVRSAAKCIEEGGCKNCSGRGRGRYEM